MSNCIFCKIINGEIPCNKVYEDDKILAFKDINPVAPIHIVVIPKQHVQSILDLDENTVSITIDVFNAINKIVRLLDIDKDGFRVVANTGINGGQTVSHLHYHILGGRSLQWPPG
ncbi:MAG: histidine triad nucleotide-binding protein [Clostridia bacterium]|nr:histidine triad nucleotide-binding protein [Clostridia bacterium]